MITLIFANVGAGKTTYLAKIAHKELKRIEKGKSRYKYIVSNTYIKGCYYLSDIHMIDKFAFKDTLLLIDEGAIEFNNRLMKMTKNEIQYFKLHRHYFTDIYIVSQSYEDIDVTLRRMYDKMYLMRRIPLTQISTLREIRKYITINQDEQIVEGYRFIKLPKFLYRKRYYHMFDSYWIPDNVPIIDPDEKYPFLVSHNDFDLIQHDKEIKHGLIHSIINKLKKSK